MLTRPHLPAIGDQGTGGVTRVAASETLWNHSCVALQVSTSAWPAVLKWSRSRS